MTHITFYSNLADKHATLLRLVQQAYEKRHQVTIYVDDEASAKTLSSTMWSKNALGFLPHVFASHPLASDTPILIDWQQKQLYQDDILINLSQSQLTSFSRYQRLIELVGVDEADKVAARVRYKFYRDRGYEIKHIDEARVET